MPRFYFHLFNHDTVWDGEGTELSTQAEALEHAANVAREIAAESVREGRLVLDHRIVVCSENNKSIGAVHFSDVVEVKSSDKAPARINS